MTEVNKVDKEFIRKAAPIIAAAGIIVCQMKGYNPDAEAIAEDSVAFSTALEKKVREKVDEEQNNGKGWIEKFKEALSKYIKKA